MKKLIFTTIALLSLGINSIFSQNGAARYSVIPYPVELIPSSQEFVLEKNTCIYYTNSQFENSVELLTKFISGSTVNSRTKNPKGSVNKIFFKQDDKIMNLEEYHLTVGPRVITITSSGNAGAFYAIQTLKQLMYTDSSKKNISVKKIPCCSIVDYPHYAYRGFHLDVSRHFFSKNYILNLIDNLGMYKMNKLQLHLTDDQGWRVQLEQFPLLTSVGAWRKFNNLDSACMDKAKTNPDFEIDKRFIKTEDGNTVYGGFYSRKEILEIIAYAAARNIEIIPEIDMPGHMSAAISSYPVLSCTGSVGWGREFSYPSCPCKPEMMNFAFRVWDEIADLFPSKYMHIGSDEVEKDTWVTSRECLDLMKQNKLDSIWEIQNYFVNEIQKHLETKNKTVIAWDDVIDGKVNNKIVIMYWRDWLKDKPLKCADNGNSIILAPWTPFYISEQHTDEALKMLYDYDPATVYPKEVTNKIIGLQSCVWTELIPSESCLEKLVYPRLQALSETCWSQKKDWESFKMRLSSHFNMMDSMKIHYNKPGYFN